MADDLPPGDTNDAALNEPEAAGNARFRGGAGAFPLRSTGGGIRRPAVDVGCYGVGRFVKWCHGPK